MALFCKFGQNIKY